MAKIHLDRLKRRYGYTGGNYQALMSKIIGEQTGFIGRRVAEINRKKLRDQAVAAARKSGRPIKVPDITEVLPARSVFIRKGAEKGKLLSDTLRDRLGKDLRQVVVDYIGEGKPLMQYQRGELRGRIKPELVDKFQAQITKTFKSYSRRDPEIGVPGNVRTIATTEVNAVLNDIKHQYMGQLVAANKGTRVEKTWVHHPDRSKEPRPGHARVAGRRRPIDESFRVPVYARTGTVKSGANKGRAKWKFTGSYVNMMYPHDPAASADEVINCFPGDQSVLPIGVESTIRSEYRGHLIVIETKSGLQFRCTPNHPILGRNGWIPANELEIGSHIISVSERQIGSGSQPYPNAMPPMIEEIFDLSSKMGSVVRPRGIDVDFHGEWRDGEIDIVSVKSKLRNEIESHLRKHFPEFLFSLADSDFVFLTGDRYSDSFGIGSLSTSGGIMGFLYQSSLVLVGHDGVTSAESSREGIMREVRSGRLSFPLFGGHLGASDETGLLRTSDHDASLGEPFGNRYGIALESSAQFFGRNAFCIESDEIIGIDVESYSGHVYNLQTKSSRYFIGDNGRFAIAHNCHCEADYRIAVKAAGRKQ